jgi:hypothetical protein
MTDYNTISTEVWEIDVPIDWSQRESSAEQSVYFESGDQTKAAYFSTWCIRDDPRCPREILDSFRDIDITNLRNMKNCAWESVGEWNSDKSQLSILGADFLDRRANYRIVCHLLARLPWVVRSSFHDYDCIDYQASKEFFRPVIESLRIH